MIQALVLPAILLSIVATAAVAAQNPPKVEFPAASPAAKVEQRVGLTDIAISYSRPSAKGRKVFGDLVPFGEV